MKTLITHINPHLDDIAAIWLFQKFFPGFEKAKIKFLSQSQTDKLSGKEDKNTVYFGIGKGRFDEHKGDTENCATSLVWQEIKNSSLAPKDKFELKAYGEFVHWVYLDDTAKLPYDDQSVYRLNSFIRSFENSSKDSLATVKLGKEILERILPKLVRKQKGLEEWEKRIEFTSKWGKSVAVEGADFSRNFAYSQGYQVVVQHSSEDNFVGITVPGPSDHDLTPVYGALLKKEPEADWYLHHSHHMILCGAKSAPDVKRSKLTLKQVIDLVKSIK